MPQGLLSILQLQPLAVMIECQLLLWERNILTKRPLSNQEVLSHQQTTTTITAREVGMN